eukprot:6865777-Prymnesium_polylepis.1
MAHTWDAGQQTAGGLPCVNQGSNLARDGAFGGTLIRKRCRDPFRFHCPLESLVRAGFEAMSTRQTPGDYGNFQYGARARGWWSLGCSRDNML